MRPLYLKIQGFGPFLEAEIPEETFQLINQEKLFLISGEIGAGKTTLFDAILFALFGEASFPDRNPEDLISHLLTDRSSLYPEVNFKFLLDGKIYYILRRPNYRNRKNTVALWINNRLYSQQISEVNLKILEIIGLKAKQFKKVFLLPQGEYRKILLSKPDERRELFELLFDTDFLSRLETFFKETLKQKRELLTTLEEREKELLQLAQVSKPEDLKKKSEEKRKRLEALEGELKDLQIRLHKLEGELKYWEQVAYLWREFKRISTLLSDLEKQIPEIEMMKIKLQKLEALKEKSFHYEHLRRLWWKLRKGKETEKHLSREARELSSLLKEKERAWEDLKNQENYYANLKTNLIKKEDLLKSLKRRLLLTEEAKKLEREFQTQVKLFEAQTEEEEKCKRALESLLQEKDLLKKFQDLRKSLEELQKMENLLQAYHQGTGQLRALLGKIQEEEEEIRQKREVYERLKERALAVTLAGKLKKGEPCPVCGSREHPHKATPDLFLSSTLESLERELQEKERQLENLKKEKNQLEGKLVTLRELIKIEESELHLQKKEILSELSSLEKWPFRFADLKQLEREEARLKEKVEKLSKERERLRGFLETLKTKRAALEGELKGLSQEAEDVISEEVLQKEISILKREIEGFEQAKEALLEELKNLEKNLTKTEISLKELQRELKEALEEYRKTLKEVFALIKSGVFQNIKELKVYWEELGKLDHLREQIQTFEKDWASLTGAKENLLRELEALSISFNPDFEALLEERLSTLANAKRLLEEKRHFLTLEIGKDKEALSQIISIENSLQQILKEKKALEEEYGTLERIANLLSGKPHGISFHSFVLSRFLGLILRRANHYLSEFTFGRYHFVEGEVFSKRFILEVFDIYTGQKREVKTLSGGESFLASLAFALGTSDTLLRLANKRSMETLLIDEGFGNLDEGTLGKVTETLLQLSQQRNKVVGVISHLRELRDRFPVILEVIKDKEEGSKIRLRRNQ